MKIKHQAKQQQHSSSPKAPMAEKVMMADSLLRPAMPTKPTCVAVPALESVVLPGGLDDWAEGEAVKSVDSSPVTEEFSLVDDG